MTMFFQPRPQRALPSRSAPPLIPSETEDPRYLREQLITCLGNKRALLPLIGRAMGHIEKRLGGRRLRVLDAFAGSGIVSRYLKRHAAYLVSNDLELYAAVIGRCYLSNAAEVDWAALRASHAELRSRVEQAAFEPGIVRRLYSPRDDRQIEPGERVFYTNRNAMLLDNCRRLIDTLPQWQRPYFLGPLLSEASIHANTAGVFKGFYKNSRTGAGQFGGNGRHALTRILGEITLPLPVLSRFECDWAMHHEDANQLVRRVRNLDVAYFDPPYNQHPYGSNYFMLNVLADYREPGRISRVAGIPDDWNRSSYNRRGDVLAALEDLLEHTDARFIVLSYNDEGFVKRVEMEHLMARHGRVRTFERTYHTFRGSRNLRSRSLNVTEHLFLVERR